MQIYCVCRFFMRSLIFFLFLSISFDLLASSLVDEEFINEQDFFVESKAC